MKANPRHGRAAFTLIELMAVITIIVILAGLVVGGMSFVTDRQKKEKAKVQMALLSKALEEYKLDFGTYPPTNDKAGDYSDKKGTDTSSILFDALYFDSDKDSNGVGQDDDQKIYLPELDPAISKQGWTKGTASKNLPIIDPWGNEYCYRSAFGEPPATGAAPANSGTQNPDFDLWSMGKDGKTNSDPKHKDCYDDIKNF
jgi:prepilin-type N-terminal cleavage/methylation domain-containing protein